MGRSKGQEVSFDSDHLLQAPPGVLPKSASKPYPVPDKKQVAKAIFYADLGTKVAICFMAFSGLRPSVLAKEDGGDGLTVDDLVMGDPGDPVEVWVEAEANDIVPRIYSEFWMGHTNMVISTRSGRVSRTSWSMRKRYRLVETFLVDEALRGLF